MRLSIRHLTTYLYPEAVFPNTHLVAMRPLDRPDRKLLHHSIRVTPAERQHFLKDAFGNMLLSAHFGEATEQIEIEAVTEVETHEFNPFDFIIEPEADRYPFSYNAIDRRTLTGFLTIGSPTACANVLPWVREALGTLPTRTIDLLSSLNQAIHKRISYQRREQAGIQTPDQTIAFGRGSCRDLAVLMMEACRQLGIAARFASGYLFHPQPTQSSAENISLHAWLEVYLPGSGWIQLDPTNGIFSDANFIPCAVASEPHLATPVRGTYSHCKSFVPSELKVELTASLL